MKGHRFIYGHPLKELVDFDYIETGEIQEYEMEIYGEIYTEITTANTKAYRSGSNYANTTSGTKVPVKVLKTGTIVYDFPVYLIPNFNTINNIDDILNGVKP